jgi:hypothetical protein
MAAAAATSEDASPSIIDKGDPTMPSLLLWFLGVPIPVIILLAILF